MKSGVFSKHHCVQLVVFLLAFAAGVCAVQVSNNLYTKERSLHSQQLLSTFVKQIQSSLNHASTATFALAQEVVHSNGSFQDFSGYSARLGLRFPSIYSFQLAPLGSISKVYPGDVEHLMVGHNVLVESSSGEAAKIALKNSPVYVDGGQGVAASAPFRLSDGRQATTLWQSVFLKHQGVEKFWGFTSVTVLLDEVLQATELPTFAGSASAYKLSWLDSNNTEHTLIESGQADFKAEQTATISVFDGPWALQLTICAEIAPWRSVGGYLLSLLMALLAAACCRESAPPVRRLNPLVRGQTRRLQNIAYIDNLTGLPNHRCFFESLESQLVAARKDPYLLSIALVDIDLFSEVNDAFGQQGGNSLLSQAARRISQCLPEGSEIARWGSDEFILMLRNQPRSVVEKVIEEINHNLTQPFEINSSTHSVTACTGVVATGNENLCANDLLGWVEQALHGAKDEGRGKLCWFSDEMRKRNKKRSTLMQQLHNVTERHELELFYQPIVCCQSQQIIKAECLLRWHHPTLGMVSPFDFVPLAEESGEIRAIGDWVFEQAVRQASYWRKHFNPEFCICVNVSPVQLKGPGMVERWLRILKANQLHASGILIEITEGTLLEHHSAAHAQLRQLREAGFQMALDDFGTGYSAMAYLKDFEIDFLKIDRSFVSNIPESESDLKLCEAIIAIAAKLDLAVVAEGVETLEQHQLLGAAGCHCSQGYYFSRPIPYDEFTARFLENANKETGPQQQVA